VIRLRLSYTSLLVLLGPLVLLALVPAPAGARPGPQYRGCRLQEAQSFLIRKNFVRKGRLDPARHARAVRYRVEHYGSVPGFEFENLNPKTARSQAVSVRFMGLPLSIHEKVAPALHCVEQRIKKMCGRRGSDRYQAHAVGGFRTDNSYRGGEISNHLFGIAIDIDPEQNPCCGCVSPWPDHPACRGSVDTIYERSDLTRCWIRAFERYGFYWLGRDPDLRDTMHFEFLGNPERVVVKW
jgi:hypothetical protein